MKEIEDQAHSLFSSLVRAPHSGTPLSFEGQTIPLGLGPQSRNQEGEILFDLSGRCGLLGFGHPLVLKSYIKSTLKGRVFADGKEVENFLNEWREFLKMLGLDTEWHISQDSNSYNAYSGRFSTFFPESIETVSTVLPFQVSPGKGDVPENVSAVSLQLAQDTLRFLKDGNFYGEDGLISLRESNLKKVFNQPWVKKVKGLCVYLSDSHPFNSESIKTHDQCLLFPLSFDEKIIGDLLAKVGC